MMPIVVIEKENTFPGQMHCYNQETVIEIEYPDQNRTSDTAFVFDKCTAIYCIIFVFFFAFLLILILTNQNDSPSMNNILEKISKLMLKSLRSRRLRFSRL